MSSSPYQAYPSQQYLEPPAVQLIATGPLKQRRLTVAFRLILVIPHAFVLLFLGLAGLAVVFIGWWGALFDARLPAFAVTYLSGWARWNVRVNAYLFLLTDAYPPFSFDEKPEYPVLIDIPERGRLNRAAVFFRLILAVWAYLVSSVVTTGAGTIALFVSWLITLIIGRLPAPLHLAYSAVLRYQVRYFCYLGMLTSTYPWKLFGDEAPTPVTATPEAAWGTLPTYGNAQHGSRPQYGSPQYGGPHYGHASPEPTAEQPVAEQPADWRLILPRSAKSVLIVFIALGLAFTGYQLATGKYTYTTTVVEMPASIDQWNPVAYTVDQNMSRWQSQIQACGQNLACATKADGQAAEDLSAFANQAGPIVMPPAAAAALTQALDGATILAENFDTLAQATTTAQYESEAASTGISQHLSQFEADLNSVAAALDKSVPPPTP